MPVTRDEIRRIAALAELAVDDAAAAELEAQISRILDYVRQLEALDTGATRVTDDRAVRLRPDEPASAPLLRPLSAFAPALRHDLFVVPRLGELGGGEEEP